MPLFRAIPLFFNSGILPLLVTVTLQGRNGCVLSISDSCSWNLVPCALLRSGVCSTSDVVCGLVVVWHFQMIYFEVLRTAVLLLFLCCASM